MTYLQLRQLALPKKLYKSYLFSKASPLQVLSPITGRSLGYNPILSITMPTVWTMHLGIC